MTETEIATTIGELVLWTPLIYIILLVMAHWWWGWGYVMMHLGRGMAGLMLWRWLPKKWQLFGDTRDKWDGPAS